MSNRTLAVEDGEVELTPTAISGLALSVFTRLDGTIRVHLDPAQAMALTSYLIDWLTWVEGDQGEALWGAQP